ncbi:MAG: hypothetical protein WBO28_09440 [Flavobacteriales bacterium]
MAVPLVVSRPLVPVPTMIFRRFNSRFSYGELWLVNGHWKRHGSHWQRTDRYSPFTNHHSPDPLHPELAQELGQAAPLVVSRPLVPGPNHDLPQVQQPFSFG